MNFKKIIIEHDNSTVIKDGILNDLDISLKVNNMFDKKHYHYETSGGVYPLSQRNMSLKFKYLF